MPSRVLVAGSINMDMVVVAERHPNIGETVVGTALEFVPGGKGANQAIASARQGTPSKLIGKLGSDRFGDELFAYLGKQGIDLSDVNRVADTATGTACIVVADADNTIIVIPGANDTLTPEDLDGIEIGSDDILVSQFEIPENVIERFFILGRQKGATTILNPAPAKNCSKNLLNLSDIIVVNESELSFFSGETVDVSKEETVVLAMRKLRVRDGQAIIATMGALGVLVMSDTEIYIPGRRVDAVDTTGAGDCFVGALAAELSRSVSLENALKYANRAASVSVQRKGAGPSMPTREEVDAVA